MKTFGELRSDILAMANVTDHFKFIAISPLHEDLWNEINAIEYKLGYSEDYLKPDSPALCEMELLTENEYEEWLIRLKEISTYY